MGRFHTVLSSRRGLCSGIFAGSVLTALLIGLWSAHPVPSVAGQNDQATIDGQLLHAGLVPHKNKTSPDGAAASSPAAKAKREEAKRDAAALSDLAASLKKAMDESDDKTMPVIYFDKAEQIEKLAKKIKNWAKAG
jgi:hypothetical protein